VEVVPEITSATRNFPGCFRCHDGKHVNEKGEAIRLQCTLCHDIPQVSIDGTLKTVASTVAIGLTPPDSHNEPNFMQRPSDQGRQYVHDVPRPDQVGQGRRELLLESGLPRPEVA